ncbi:MAG: thiolase family protein [Dehalococcoidia bacterium]
MSKGKIAIVGIGEVPTGWYPERHEWDIIYDSCMQAVRDAGINKNEIEGVICSPAIGQPKLDSELVFGKLPEELGLKGCKDIVSVNGGGSTSANLLRMAEHWINTGVAKTVLIMHASKYSSIDPNLVIKTFATAGMSMEWEYPFGTTYNGMVAMVTERFMQDNGVSPEEMASIPVAFRKWAELDPNAMFRKPLTVEKVLSTRMISTPLHSMECNMLADGGAALLVTSATNAAKICKTPVYKLGEGSRYCQATLTQRTDETNAAQYKAAASDAFREAGLSINHMNVLELYCAYPVLMPYLLVALGVSKNGKEAIRFIADGNTWPGGKLPCSTIGDALSRGHTGSGVGFAYLVETARQLMGKAGERQVKDCKYALMNCAGGSGMNMIFEIFGRKLK